MVDGLVIDRVELQQTLMKIPLSCGFTSLCANSIEPPLPLHLTRLYAVPLSPLTYAPLSLSPSLNVFAQKSGSRKLFRSPSRRSVGNTP